MSNLLDYYVGQFDEKTVFLHECEWVLHNGSIPEGKLVAHKDGDTKNCIIDNLFLVDENKEYKDLHTFKPFHENSIDKEFIEKHFPDIGEKLFKIQLLEPDKISEIRDSQPSKEE